MTYWPRHQPQLGRGPTSAVDCGTRSVQMGLDAATKGAIVPSIRKIRRVMDDQDQTNYTGWDKVVDHIGASAELRGIVTHNSTTAKRWLKNGGGLVLAIDYGNLRRAAPAKTGSESFNGGHAVYLQGFRKASATVRDFDSLLDGRYRGCPKGPVWMKWSKLVAAAAKVSLQYGWTNGRIYALLITTKQDIKRGIVISPPNEVEPDPVDTLLSILADFREVAEDCSNPEIDGAILAFEETIGSSGDEVDMADISDGLGAVE